MGRLIVVVTGAAGQLGRALRLTDPGLYEVRYLTRAELDIAEPHAVAESPVFSGAGLVLNCAAFTDVDAAEEEPGRGRAERVNALAPGWLAARCRAEGAGLVHVSTDYVFGGDAASLGGRAPIAAAATPCPLGSYGETKLAGERAVLASGAAATVLRTAWVYSGDLLPEAKDFVSTMLRLAREGIEPTVVDDQFGSPTYAVDLARALWALCAELVAGRPGPRVRHAVGAGRASWYEVAREVFSAAGFDPAHVAPVDTAGFPTRARRPAWSVLESDFALPEWRDGVRRAVAARL